MHKVFISFKFEDLYYKNKISDMGSVDLIDKSLETLIDSENQDYIMRIIRRDYLRDSTVTIFLIGAESYEKYGNDQYYIKKEMQASLTSYEGIAQNGILGVVLPGMYDSVYGGESHCLSCGSIHNLVNINDSTVIKEFSYNYYIPNNKCAWGEKDRYCVLVKWDDFVFDPQKYIDAAFAKRSEPIEKKIKVRL